MKARNTNNIVEITSVPYPPNTYTNQHCYNRAVMSPPVIDSDEEATWTRMLAWEATSSERTDDTMVREEILKDQNGKYIRWRAETETATKSRHANRPPEATITRLDEQELKAWYKANHDRENFKILASDETIKRIGFEAGEPLYIDLLPAGDQSPWATAERYYPDDPTEIAAWLGTEQDKLNSKIAAVRRQLEAGQLEQKAVTDVLRELSSLTRATNAVNERFFGSRSATDGRRDTGGGHS